MKLGFMETSATPLSLQQESRSCLTVLSTLNNT